VTKYVVDSCAWIEYLEGSEKGVHLATILESNANTIITSSATLAEIISKFERHSKNSTLAAECITSLSTIQDVHREIAIAAGKVHAKAKKKIKDFGMLDAFVAATAQITGGKILTGDAHFKTFKNAVLI